jgi:hypothetical protein
MQALFETDAVPIRRKRRLLMCATDDEPVQGPKEKFKANFTLHSLIQK